MGWIWIIIIIAVLSLLIFILLTSRISLHLKLNIIPSEKRLYLVVYLGFLPIYKKQVDFEEMLESEQELDEMEAKAEKVIRTKWSDIKKAEKPSWDRLLKIGNTLTIHKMESRLYIGTGSASSTGIIMGPLLGITALLEQLIHRVFSVNNPIVLQVEPSFHLKCFQMTANGIFSFRLGKAIYVWLRYVNRKPGKTRN